jgi:hypothetical protein
MIRGLHKDSIDLGLSTREASAVWKKFRNGLAHMADPQDIVQVFVSLLGQRRAGIANLLQPLLAVFADGVPGVPPRLTRGGAHHDRSETARPSAGRSLSGLDFIVCVGMPGLDQCSLELACARRPSG